jgi:hypothetical protein
MRSAFASVGIVLAACSHPSSTVATAASSSAPTASVVAQPIEAGIVEEAGLDAAVMLHPERAFALPADSRCVGDLRCLVDHAYAVDERARTLAIALFDETGDVAGTDHESTMDGGFRGTLHIYPALALGEARVQLERVVAAARDFEWFFKRVYPDHPPEQYRWRDLSFRFFRSKSGPKDHEVERTTPSAYAIGPRPAPTSAESDISFSLAYNVKGSLLTSDVGVRETLFHEVFHMNDAAHGDWSPRALWADYTAIVKKCGATNVACLGPYAPNDTMVRGGTYYAFEPNNGLPVREYAAELALRWYKEQRAVLRNEPPPMGRAFKCGPPENRRSWDALVKEFFGVDLVPACK